jgi:hypothetical protein
MKIRYTATGLLLIVALATALVPAPVRASDQSTSEERPIRLFATSRFSPIGAIKLNSLSGAAVAIDGRIAQGEAPIWGGELIKVAAAWKTVARRLTPLRASCEFRINLRRRM